jgi:hypothetical protein
MSERAADIDDLRRRLDDLRREFAGVMATRAGPDLPTAVFTDRALDRFETLSRELRNVTFCVREAGTDGDR